MSATVTASPREIHDLVFRICRVSEIDAGSADRLARNIVFALIHHGDGAAAFTDAVSEGGTALVRLAAAADLVEAAEVEVRSGGSATAGFGEAVPLAAIAATIWEAAGRGCGVSDDARPVDSTMAIFELAFERKVQDQAEVDAAREITLAAHSNGVEVDSQVFHQLEVAAAPYLVSEAILDAAD